MRLPLALVFLYLAAGSAQTGPADWHTATDLPNVDMTGLTAVRKRAALKALREQTCVCGCDMMVAECRIKDSSCGDSRALAEIIVNAIREGKNPEKAVADSELVRRKSSEPTLLEAAIPLPLDGAPAKGPANARITLVEFSDFECPFCSKAVARLETILKEYPKDARLVYKHFPLPTHPHARAAAEASVAAQAQDKFWPMYEKLFANSSHLSDSVFLTLAKEAGLDLTRLSADMKSERVRKIVAKDIADGEKAQVNSTPTLFINGKRYNGPLEMVILKPVLDAELKAAK